MSACVCVCEGQIDLICFEFFFCLFCFPGQPLSGGLMLHLLFGIFWPSSQWLSPRTNLPGRQRPTHTPL